MEFREFKQLFTLALNTAIKNTERRLGKSIPVNCEIILYGAGNSGNIVDIDEAANSLYIDGEKFYRVIDVAVQQISPDVSRVFVRISGHKPVPFEETWNTPKGSGPFKQIMAQIQELDT